MFSLLPSFITLTQAFFPATFNRLGGGYLVFISIIIYVYMLSHDRLFSKIYIIQVKAVYFNGCTYFGNHLSRNSKGILGGTFAQIYANPIFRLPEFIIGMCVAQICLRKKERHFVRYSENSSPFLCASDQHRCAVLSNLF